MIAAIRDQGFSLLEVVIATLILAMTFAAVFPIFGSAPGRLKDSRQIAYATHLAASRMEHEVARGAWNLLPASGVDREWSWEVTGQPYDDDNTLLQDYPLLLTVRTWRTERPENVLVSLEKIVWVME